MIPFIITFLAGISTMLGFFTIYLRNNDQNKIIGKSLAFASGVMISVSINDLLFNSIKGLSSKYNILFTLLLCTLFVVLGIIFSLLIDRKLPLDGNNKLYKTGIISMSTIILHNIPEGIATFLTSSQNIGLGITLALAIGLHNIPEGISIAIPIYYSTNNKIKTFLYTFISGISELLGAFIAFLFLGGINNLLFLSILFSLIAGIMIGVAVYELLPTSRKYVDMFNSIIYFIIGFIFMYISCLIV